MAVCLEKFLKFAYGCGQQKGCSLWVTVRWRTEGNVNQKESCNPRCGQPWLIAHAMNTWQVVDVWQVHVCAYIRTQAHLVYSCVFIWVQIPEFFKCEIHVAFKLFPNISVELEEIHIPSTNTTTELAGFSPARRMLPCRGAWILKAAEDSFFHSINSRSFVSSARLWECNNK